MLLLSTSGLRRIASSWPILADGCSAHEVDDGTNFEVLEVNCLLEAFLLRHMGVCAKKELAELKLQLPVKMLKVPAKMWLAKTPKQSPEFLSIKYYFPFIGNYQSELPKTPQCPSSIKPKWEFPTSSIREGQSLPKWDHSKISQDEFVFRFVLSQGIKLV